MQIFTIYRINFNPSVSIKVPEGMDLNKFHRVLISFKHLATSICNYGFVSDKKIVL